jgi:hypothetical protein
MNISRSKGPASVWRARFVMIVVMIRAGMTVVTPSTKKQNAATFGGPNASRNSLQSNQQRN